MRLVCPNCEAKYEVPEDAIPETGRDVQCANCGHAWYQMRPRAAGAVESVTAAIPAVAAPVAVSAGPSPEAAVVTETAKSEPAFVEDAVSSATFGSAESASLPDVVEEVAEGVLPDAPGVAEAVARAEGLAVEVGQAATGMVANVKDMAAGAADAVTDEVAPVAAAVVAEASTLGQAVHRAADGAVDDDHEDLGSAPAQGATTPYAVDDSVLAILREEAEREASARRAETTHPVETKTDPGISAAATGAKKPVEVISTDETPAMEDDGDAKLAARRTRLPDVEEINSTLRPSDVPQDDPAPEVGLEPVEGRSSFRSGFLLVMTVAILGMALYIGADALGRAVPALAGPLAAYVSFVDSLRLKMDGLMQSATVAINGT